MTEDIRVPIIEICDGWTVDEIETLEDCNDAFAVLTALIVSIEARMDDLAIAGEELSVPYKKAKTALRWKKAALSVVNLKRGEIGRKQQDAKEAHFNTRVCQYFAAMHPDQFEAARRHVLAGTVDLVTEAAE